MQKVAISRFRRELRDWRTIIETVPGQRGILEVTHYNQRVGFFVSAERTAELNLLVSESFITERFRDSLGVIRKKLGNGTLDAAFLCEWNTERDRRVAALVSPYFAEQLGVEN